MSSRRYVWGRIPWWHAVPLLVGVALVAVTLLVGPGSLRTVLAFLAGIAAALTVVLAVDDIRRGPE